MLKIKEISFKNFRSYKDFSLKEINDLTIFVGPNAIGKTNIIEGIGLLTSLSSFRNGSAKELIRHNSNNSKIFINIEDENRKLTISHIISDGKRSYLLNDKHKRTKDLKGLIPSVIFTPDDLQLIKGSNSLRRQALDNLGSQLNSNYYQIIKDYEKVLKHKNRLLKDEASEDIIIAIDELIIKVGAQLSNYRHSLFLKLIENLKKLYSEITGSDENLEGFYIPSWQKLAEADSNLYKTLYKENDQKNDQNQLKKESEKDQKQQEFIQKEIPNNNEARRLIEESLKAYHNEEIKRKRTLVGPHRDEIIITINNMDSSIYASQGQQRSIVLAWKLAEANLIKEILGQLPVLLLDDVMSELDEKRRESLVSYLSDDMQTFITTANIDYFDEDMLSRADIIQLDKK